MLPNALSVLEDRGYRLTRPRKAVVLLLSKEGRGLTAESICEQMPEVGRATVYRTIKLLVQEGVACKVSMPDGTALYTLDESHHHHHHTVCVRCGRTREFRHPIAERMVHMLQDGVEGEIVGHRIELYIVCDACKGAAPKQ